MKNRFQFSQLQRINLWKQLQKMKEIFVKFNICVSIWDNGEQWSIMKDNTTKINYQWDTNFFFQICLNRFAFIILVLRFELQVRGVDAAKNTLWWEKPYKLTGSNKMQNFVQFNRVPTAILKKKKKLKIIRNKRNAVHRNEQSASFFLWRGTFDAFSKKKKNLNT